ncbi:hypothetical protein [Psychroserpens sp. SPM9]|uniref:hypothetical protein n=1 Tax=Psychroserpens sp. SPM9 TaxID=2975598 RepID=UPI0021A4BF92|nr:hypothetical protein [Psychroserpens sp. SPM9]MDG5492863.1 hypothetical protein [Psychroserpens sp. SPM9]
MKHLFKHTLLFLGIVVMTFSCQKENLDEQDPNNNLEEDGNTLFKKGKLYEYTQVKDFVKSLKTKKKIEDIHFRTGLESENGFIILEHQEIAIHSGDEYNTYTIPIVKHQQLEGTFSNLVVQFKVASDSTSAYILTYKPNSGYLDAYALDNQTPFSGQVSYESLNYDGSLDGLNARRFCQTVHISYCNWDQGTQGAVHLAGSNCTPSFTWVESYQICDYSSPTGDPETIEPPEGSGGGGGGSSSSPNTGNSTSTIPADLISEVVTILNLNTSNNQQELVWLNTFSNFPEVISMYLYLKQNEDFLGNITQEDKDFVEAVIEAMIEDDDLEFESLKTWVDGMDKKCQRNVLFMSIMKVNSTFTNMIKSDYIISEDNDIKISDLSVGQGNPPLVTGSGAGTDPNPGSNTETNADVIDINFNNTHLDKATNLGFVNTFYHELLHAHIYHLYHDDELLTEYPNYTTLKIALDNWFANPNDTTKENIAQQELHNIYVDFIDDLADSLHKYCIENNIGGVDLIYAKKLVWGGLNGYDVFNDDDNLTPAERTEAQTLLAYENFNNTQNAKGTKTCN